MNQAKHTPGPWLVTPNFPKGMTTVCQHTGTGWKPVADCHAAGRDDVECAANATLICAAPDLLAALLAIVNEAGPKFGLDDGPGTINRMAYAARQAIAKAGGAA